MKHPAKTAALCCLLLLCCLLCACSGGETAQPEGDYRLLQTEEGFLYENFKYGGSLLVPFSLTEESGLSCEVSLLLTNAVYDNMDQGISLRFTDYLSGEEGDCYIAMNSKGNRYYTAESFSGWELLDYAELPMDGDDVCYRWVHTADGMTLLHACYRDCGFYLSGSFSPALYERAAPALDSLLCKLERTQS